MQLPNICNAKGTPTCSCGLEMAYQGAPIAPYNYGVTMSLLGNICLQYGSEEQKKEYLPQIARGELFCGQGYSEPQAGKDVAWYDDHRLTPIHGGICVRSGNTMVGAIGTSGHHEDEDEALSLVGKAALEGDI